MAYADLKIDYVFRRVFGQHPDVLLGLQLWPDAERDASAVARIPLVSHWRMAEKHGGGAGIPQIEYVFCELPKLGERAPQTPGEQWAAVFRDAHRWTAAEALRQGLGPAQMTALALSNEANLHRRRGRRVPPRAGGVRATPRRIRRRRPREPRRRTPRRRTPGEARDAAFAVRRDGGGAVADGRATHRRVRRLRGAGGVDHRAGDHARVLSDVARNVGSSHASPRSRRTPGTSSSRGGPPPSTARRGNR